MFNRRSRPDTSRRFDESRINLVTKEQNEDEINTAIKRCCLDDSGTTKTLAILDRIISNPRLKSFSFRFGEVEFTAKYD
jgi:hypothetical protein